METVIYEKQGQIAVITFNRPEALNAYNGEVIGDLISAFELARQDNEVRVIICKGKGRAFSSGHDVKAIARMNFEELQYDLGLERDCARLIMRLGKPIVAAVQGYCLAGGFEYAMLADIRIAAEGTKFGFPEPSMGGGISFASTKILPQLVGLGKAKELVLVLTGEMIDAREAERLGLVNRVVAPEELDDAAMSIAKKIASSPPLAIQRMKYALDHGLDWDYDAALEYEMDSGLIEMASGDMAEGFGAKSLELGRKE